PTLRAQLATMQIETDGLAARLFDVVDHVERPRDATMLRVLESKAAAGEVAIAVTSTAMRACGAPRSPSISVLSGCSATPMPAPSWRRRLMCCGISFPRQCSEFHCSDQKRQLRRTREA